MRCRRASRRKPLNDTAGRAAPHPAGGWGVDRHRGGACSGAGDGSVGPRTFTVPTNDRRRRGACSGIGHRVARTPLCRRTTDSGSGLFRHPSPHLRPTCPRSPTHGTAAFRRRPARDHAAAASPRTRPRRDRAGCAGPGLVLQPADVGLACRCLPPKAGTGVVRPWLPPNAGTPRGTASASARLLYRTHPCPGRLLGHLQPRRGLGPAALPRHVGPAPAWRETWRHEPA